MTSVFTVEKMSSFPVTKGYVLVINESLSLCEISQESFPYYNSTVSDLIVF